MAACQAGVPRVHVINGGVDEGLLAEVFSNEGIGTLVYANEYRQIRRARRSDVRSIQQLIQASVEKRGAAAALAGRDRDGSSTTTTSSRWTATRSPASRCTSTRRRRRASWPACCVRPSHENQGIGRRMVQFVEDAGARDWGSTQLLALSTQAFNFFQSKGGFAEGTPDDLPPARRERYEQSGRRSKVLVKKL